MFKRSSQTHHQRHGSSSGFDIEKSARRARRREEVKVTFENIAGVFTTDAYADGIDSKSMARFLADLHSYCSGSRDHKIHMPRSITNPNKEVALLPEGFVVRSRRVDGGEAEKVNEELHIPKRSTVASVLTTSSISTREVMSSLGLQGFVSEVASPTSPPAALRYLQPQDTDSVVAGSACPPSLFTQRPCTQGCEQHPGQGCVHETTGPQPGLQTTATPASPPGPDLEENLRRHVFTNGVAQTLTGGTVKFS